LVLTWAAQHGNYYAATEIPQHNSSSQQRRQVHVHDQQWEEQQQHIHAILNKAE